MGASKKNTTSATKVCRTVALNVLGDWLDSALLTLQTCPRLGLAYSFTLSHIFQ